MLIPGPAQVQNYSPPTARCQFYTYQTPSAPGSMTNLAWTKFDPDGADLVDLTDPVNPKIYTAGIYQVKAEIACGTNTAAGGWLDIYLAVDVNGDDENLELVFPFPPHSAKAYTSGGVTIVYYIPAGGVINFDCVNNTADTLLLNFNGSIQKIT